MILDNFILLIVLGSEFISKTRLPRKICKLHLATVIFKQYMTEVYEEESSPIAKGEAGSGNLVTSLISAFAEQTKLTKKNTLSPGHDQGGLIESVIYDNLFLFNFACHDITVHTLAFAVVILASQPLVRDWVSEELRHVLGNQKTDAGDYSTKYPLLKRCLVVLGIRNCPGKKSSQVEFVATLASLFRDWRVDPVPEWLQDMDMARKRVMRMAEEDTGQVLLLQMLHPEKAALAWKRR
ncbi:hypothetical protein MMC15_006350 [Xylographa vitiligo]|nr:hypothetical protein [Xylographa vitiligo]